MFAALIAGILAFNVISELQRASRADAAADTIALANLLFDDLERERSEAIYLAAAPDAGAADFAARTAATDQTLRSLMSSPLFTATSLPADQQAIVDRAAAALDRLAQLRAPVIARTAGPAQAGQGYTDVHDMLIENMGAMFTRLSGRDACFPDKFVALAKLQDRVALEMAIGYVSFAIADMPASLHTMFNTALAEQAEHQARYRDLAGPGAPLDLDAVLERSAANGLYEARAALHAAAAGVAPDPVHRTAWSQTIALRVTDLAVARNRFSREQLAQLVADCRERLRSALVRAAIGFVLLLLAFGVVGFILILRPGSSRQRMVHESPEG